MICIEEGVAQSVEHWTSNLAAQVRSPVGEQLSDLMYAFLNVQMESNWLGCQCVTVGTLASECGTIKAVGIQTTQGQT